MAASDAAALAHGDSDIEADVDALDPFDPTLASGAPSPKTPSSLLAGSPAKSDAGESGSKLSGPASGRPKGGKSARGVAKGKRQCQGCWKLFDASTFPPNSIYCTAVEKAINN
eukprot:8087923-Alexandrium_andersonii.AAC.1